jgi:hypothetical protein
MNASSAEQMQRSNTAVLAQVAAKPYHVAWGESRFAHRGKIDSPMTRWVCASQVIAVVRSAVQWQSVRVLNQVHVRSALWARSTKSLRSGSLLGP